jgi:hypothetical protein
VLRASSRVLKPGGPLSFLVIAVADGLSAAETNIALDAGPEHIDAGPGYLALMDAAGFEDVEVIDVTGEYLVTLTAWIREWDADSTELEQLMGVEEFAERQTRRRKALATARDGLLQRYLISATRP